MRFVKFIILAILYWFIAIPMSKITNSAVSGLVTALLIEIAGYYFLKWFIKFVINRMRVKGSG